MKTDVKVRSKVLRNFVILTVISLIFRFILFDYLSEDYVDFLEKWGVFFRTNGGFYAISKYNGDYNGIYVAFLALISYIPIKDIYLIKLLSVVFDYLLAFVSSLVVFEFFKFETNECKQKVFLNTYVIFIFLFQIIMNSSMWAQCDSIYSFFCILSLLYCLKDKFFKSICLFSVALSFKLQAIFMLPLFVILFFFKKEIKWYYFLIIPIIMILMNTPCILFGKGILSTFTIYFKQVGEYNTHLTFGIPNMYMIFEFINNTFKLNFYLNLVKVLTIVGVIVTLLILLLILVLLKKRKVEFDNKKIIVLCFWLIMIVTYFLPKMHDRYLYLCEVLSIICYFILKKGFNVMIFFNIMALFIYCIYFILVGKSLMYFFILPYTIFVIFYSIFAYRFICDIKKNDKLDVLVQKIIN